MGLRVGVHHSFLTIGGGITAPKGGLMKLGYIAINQYGETVKLTELTHPRKQLLTKLGLSHCEKMYCDRANGEPAHVGYVIGGGWWSIYEIHDWSKGGADVHSN
jgi:hypothetical protein